MRRRRLNIREKQEKSRAEKISNVGNIFMTFNNLSQTIPSILTGSAETQKSLEDAEKTLSDLGENQFPAAIKAAPYVGGAFAITSLLLLRSIYKEIS